MKGDAAMYEPSTVLYVFDEAVQSAVVYEKALYNWVAVDKLVHQDEAVATNVSPLIVTVALDIPAEGNLAPEPK